MTRFTAQHSTESHIFCTLIGRSSCHLYETETPPGSEILSFFSLYSRLLADFLSHFGKWVRLIKFEAEYEHFYACKVEKPQNNTSSPSFHVRLHVHVHVCLHVHIHVKVLVIKDLSNHGRRTTELGA